MHVAICGFLEPGRWPYLDLRDWSKHRLRTQTKPLRWLLIFLCQPQRNHEPSTKQRAPGVVGTAVGAAVTVGWVLVSVTVGPGIGIGLSVVADSAAEVSVGDGTLGAVVALGSGSSLSVVKVDG